MRVIAGQFKGKRLFSPENNARPTTDRIKESMFNILLSKRDLFKTAALDLFSGSGALGIEALSRGASLAVFVDRDRESIRLSLDNLRHVGAKADTYETYAVDFAFAVKKLQGKAFDVIFIDPPYGFGLCSRAVALVAAAGLKKEDGVIVVEHAADERVDAAGYSVDERKMGSTVLTFLS